MYTIGMTEILYMYVLHNRIQPCILKVCTIITCELPGVASFTGTFCLGLLPSAFSRDLILEGGKKNREIACFFGGGEGI